MIRPPSATPEAPSIGRLVSRQVWWLAERARPGRPSSYFVAHIDPCEGDTAEGVFSTLRAFEAERVHGCPVVVVVLVEVIYRAGLLRPWSARAVRTHDLVALRAVRDLADILLEPLALDREKPAHRPASGPGSHLADVVRTAAEMRPGGAGDPALLQLADRALRGEPS